MVAHTYTIDDEHHPQSPYSPDVVQDDEALLRVVFCPEHLQDHQVIETAIALEDLSLRGFSVDRRNYAQRQILQDIIQRQMQHLPERRQESTLAILPCGIVRQLCDTQGERAFLVIDTAIPEHIAHAAIYAARPGGKGHLRKLRSSTVFPAWLKLSFI